MWLCSGLLVEPATASGLKPYRRFPRLDLRTFLFSCPLFSKATSHPSSSYSPHRLIGSLHFPVLNFSSSGVHSQYKLPIDDIVVNGPNHEAVCAVRVSYGNSSRRLPTLPGTHASSRRWRSFTGVLTAAADDGRGLRTIFASLGATAEWRDYFVSP